MSETVSESRNLKTEYKDAVERFQDLNSLKGLKDVVKRFKALGDFKDSQDYLAKCKEKEPLFQFVEEAKKKLDKAETEVRKCERELARVRKEHNRGENELSPLQTQILSDFDLLETRRAAYDARMATYYLDVAAIEEEYKKEKGELEQLTYVASERVRTLTNKQADLENQLRTTFALDFKRKRMLQEDIEQFKKDIWDASVKEEEAAKAVVRADQHKEEKVNALNAELFELQRQVNEIKERIAMSEQMAANASSRTSVAEGIVFSAEHALERAEEEAEKLRKEWEEALERAKA